jgi:hypothetical protein
LEGNHRYLSNLSRWRPADHGDHGAGVFLVFLCVVVVGCGPRERRRERLCSDSQSLLSAGFEKLPHTSNTVYEKIDSEFPVGF